MDNNEEKKINNISAIISGIIIAVVGLLGAMIIGFLDINIILPKSVRFLIRPVSRGIMIFFVIVLVEKVS